MASLERGSAAHGLAGQQHTGRRRAGSDSADPKPLQLSGSPLVKMRGEAEKLPSASAGNAAITSNLLETVN